MPYFSLASLTRISTIVPTVTGTGLRVAIARSGTARVDSEALSSSVRFRGSPSLFEPDTLLVQNLDQPVQVKGLRLSPAAHVPADQARSEFDDTQIIL